MLHSLAPLALAHRQRSPRSDLARARLVSRGHIVVEQSTQGAHVGGGAMVGLNPIPNDVAGALLAGVSATLFFLGYSWFAAGAAAGAIYLLVFRKETEIKV